MAKQAQKVRDRAIAFMVKIKPGEAGPDPGRMTFGELLTHWLDLHAAGSAWVGPEDPRDGHVSTIRSGRLVGRKTLAARYDRLVRGGAAPDGRTSCATRTRPCSWPPACI